jgi:hypothetical protein
MQDEVSSLKFGTEMWGHLKFMYEPKQDRSEPDHEEPNQGLRRQVVLWNLHSSEILCSIE